MAEFHFLRPWWLALLPIGAWLIWQLLRGRGDGGGWRSFVDAPLRSYVLAEPEVLRESRWPLIAALVAWTLALGALAGPAWERLPVPAFRSDEALVVALDLSKSMDASDLEPTRLARAKLKLLDLMTRRTAGQTALIVFSTHAFTVTPLTTDTRTIASLVTSVTTDIMPTQGSSVAAALEKAQSLLKQTGLNLGDVLLITDSETEPADLAAVRDLKAQGFHTSVLAVGTEQGAPIGQGKGGFVTDANGQVVIPQLDAQALQRLALAGGGRFARLAPDDRDLDTLFPSASALAAVGTTTESGGEYQADVWRDRGSWLALALLPFLALSFRRGWICVWLLWFALPAPRAEAFEWRDLWQRRDQQGYDAMQSEQAARAAQLFNNPEWRGAAQYRAGNFTDSATTLTGIGTADGQYNRGNALAKAGEVDEAIAAYDRALELDPNHADAKFNRDLLAEAKKKDEEQKQKEKNESGDQGQPQDGDKQADGSQDDKDQQDKQNEQQQAQDQQRGDQQSGQDQEQQAKNEDDEGKQDDAGEQQQAQNQEQQNGETKPAPGPEEVEKWASEQAAEQWLRRVPQDPGGLLRRKFLYQYQRFGVDQDGKSVLGDGKSSKPW